MMRRFPMKTWTKMVCPTAPWSHVKIRLLARYLDVSLAKLAALIGISKIKVYGWTRNKLSRFEAADLKHLDAFKKKIPALRKTAISQRENRELRQGLKRQTTDQPMKVKRITEIVDRWGWSIVEFAIFSGTSYDTVSSWRGGRRALRFVDKIKLLESAEAVAKKRGFKKTSDCNAIVEFVQGKFGPRYLTKIPSMFKGSFDILGKENLPGVFAKGEAGDRLEIRQGSGKPQKTAVFISLGKKKLEFHGLWQKLRVGGKDFPVLELHDLRKTSQPIQEQAGCIVFRPRHATITLWSQGAIPIRLLAGTH